MSNGCVEICDAVLEMMCTVCPNWKKCQNAEDEANHDQMLECMGEILSVDRKAYPKSGRFEPCREE